MTLRNMKGLRWVSAEKGRIKMLRLMLMDTPFYIAVLALGLIGIYRVRDYLMERQRRKDAERAKSEESEAEQA